MGMYVAFAFFEFRATGDLVLPILGLPARVHLLARPTLASALAVAVVLAALLGLVVYGLVFRPLRRAPVLARVVASLGLLLYLQEIVRLRFPIAGSGVSVRRAVLPEGPVRIAGAASPRTGCSWPAAWRSSRSCSARSIAGPAAGSRPEQPPATRRAPC